MEIRNERASDRQAVFGVLASAFETDAEARLVEGLRRRVTPLVSLVAESDGAIAGHILFTPVTLADSTGPLLMGLAPMAVLPECQRTGVGSRLVRAGLEGCREIGAVGVVVLGDANYYPRFGFVPATRFGLRSEYDVPDDVFLALELVSGALAGRTGTIRYHDAFRDVT